MIKVREFKVGEVPFRVQKTLEDHVGYLETIPNPQKPKEAELVEFTITYRVKDIAEDPLPPHGGGTEIF